MKKTLLIAIAVVSTVFAKNNQALPADLNMDPKRIVLLTDVTSDVTKELIAGLHPDIAVECKEGMSLPIEYAGNFELFSVKYVPNIVIQLQKTCYLRFVKKNGRSAKCYASYDLKNWEKMDKFLRTLELSDLDLNCGMSQDKSHIAIEVNQK